MSSLLRDAKNYYGLFFQNGEWDDGAAEDSLKGKDNFPKRIEIIRQIYHIILSGDKTTPALKQWITTPLSIQNIANLMGTNENTIKSSFYYFNQTLEKELHYGGENLLKICITKQNITLSDWHGIETIMENFLLNHAVKLFKGEKIFTSKNLLVNIPRKSELHKDITDKEFDALLNLITPYFITVRSKNQQLINESRAAGYFNYLLTPTVPLTDTDRLRRDKILKLLDKDTRKLLKATLRQESIPEPKHTSPQQTEILQQQNIPQQTSKEQSAISRQIGKIAKTENYQVADNIEPISDDDEIIDLGINPITGGYKTTFIKF